MPTLKELLEMDDAVSTKTAAAPSAGADDAGIADLATAMGLFGETKVAAEEEKKEEGDEKKDDEEKTASMGGLFNALFPDESPVSSEKTAEEKVAEAEEARGMRAFEHFSDRFDGRIEKLAAGVLTGSAYKDSQPTNHLPNNKPADAGSGINTKSTSVQDEVKAKNDSATVGHFEQKHAQAMRKHLLLSQLEG